MRTTSSKQNKGYFIDISLSLIDLYIVAVLTVRTHFSSFVAALSLFAFNVSVCTSWQHYWPPVMFGTETSSNPSSPNQQLPQGISDIMGSWVFGLGELIKSSNDDLKMCKFGVYISLHGTTMNGDSSLQCMCEHRCLFPSTMLCILRIPLNGDIGFHVQDIV